MYSNAYTNQDDDEVTCDRVRLEKLRHLQQCLRRAGKKLREVAQDVGLFVISLISLCVSLSHTLALCSTLPSTASATDPAAI